MGRVSNLEPHSALIVEERLRGQRYTEIAETLNAQGCKTSGNNISKWILSRVKRLNRYAADLALLQKKSGKSGLTSEPSKGEPLATSQPATASMSEKMKLEQLAQEDKPKSPLNKAEMAERLAGLAELIERTKTDDPFQKIMARRK